MAQQSNLPLVNPNDDVDLRVNQYFEDFFKDEVAFESNQYDLVKSYFLEATNQNLEATAALTAAVLTTCQELDIFPQDIIENLKAGAMEQTLTAFLNLSRRGSGLLGYSKQLVPPINVRRQIRV